MNDERSAYNTMIKISELEKIGLKITWKLLYLGYSGYSDFGKQISAGDIIAFAIDQLVPDNCNNDICELASSYESEDEDILRILHQLSMNEKSNNKFELRKSMSSIMSNALKTKDPNYIDGLMELTDLWIELGYPLDSPHVIQGRENNMSTHDYYTEENYEKLYHKNIHWLKTELAYLRMNQ